MRCLMCNILIHAQTRKEMLALPLFSDCIIIIKEMMRIKTTKVRKGHSNLRKMVTILTLLLMPALQLHKKGVKLNKTLIGQENEACKYFLWSEKYVYKLETKKQQLDKRSISNSKYCEI